MLLSKHIWIINPFDQLPNESDVPLRFWTLSKTLVSEGYIVTWWSSDFSHQHKIKRLPCIDTDGFSIKLIKTPSYKNNIGIARIRSHMAFSKNFYNEAIKGLKNNDLEMPFRIVASLPPLWIAESVFKIKDYINTKIDNDPKKLEFKSKVFCKVVIDIMDAWPEVFYRILPEKFRHFIAPLFFLPFHRSASIAYKHADKISAVGQSYLEIAKRYLKNHQNDSHIYNNVKKNFINQNLVKPLHLCYHGVDLNRFKSSLIFRRLKKYNKLDKEKLFHSDLKELKNFKKKRHLQIVYIGSMNLGYDIQTIVDFAKKWKNEGKISIQIHFAGIGDQLNDIKKKTKKLGLLESTDFKNQKSQIIFHGYIKNNDINRLLLSSDIALVLNRPNTLVACPYKAGEYAGAGLAIISCLNGEFNRLLNSWNSGLNYEEGNVQSLYNAIVKYVNDFDLLNKHCFNARKMAENLFDQKKTYKKFSKFIINDL